MAQPNDVAAPPDGGVSASRTVLDAATMRRALKPFC